MVQALYINREIDSIYGLEETALLDDFFIRSYGKDDMAVLSFQGASLREILLFMSVFISCKSGISGLMKS